MAINSGRIVAGPTATRAATKISCVALTNTIPPSSYVRIDPETDFPEIINQDPQREGQMLVYNAQNDTALYVVVDISGTLTWKRCAAITGYIDSTTGKPFGL